MDFTAHASSATSVRPSTGHASSEAGQLLSYIIGLTLSCRRSNNNREKAWHAGGTAGSRAHAHLPGDARTPPGTRQSRTRVQPHPSPAVHYASSVGDVQYHGAEGTSSIPRGLYAAQKSKPNSNFQSSHQAVISFKNTHTRARMHAHTLNNVTHQHSTQIRILDSSVALFHPVASPTPWLFGLMASGRWPGSV